MKYLSLFLGAATLWGTAPFASAQTSIFDVPADKAESFIDVGAAGLSRETYVGSGGTTTMVLPYINAGYKGRLFFNPAVGAGVYAINTDKFRLGAAANIALGRDGKDTPYAGTAFEDEFKVKTGATAKVFTRTYLSFAAFDVVGTLPVGGDLKGAKLETLLTTQIKPVKNLRLMPGVRASFNTRGWLDTNYGINTRQAEASGLTSISYAGGLSTIGAHVAGYYRLSDDYEIVGVINHSWLVGDVKDSPLTPSDTGVTMAIGVARKF